jgi:uncharacterized protein involved in exopolysaccharide biosynthesis
MNEYEIDLSQIFNVLKVKRRVILKTILIFLLIGLFFAFGSKVEYKATTKLLSDSNEGINQNMSGLSGLAGLAGLNLDMASTEALTPDLYPQIIQSIPFQLGVLHQNITFEKLDTTITSYNYFDHFYKKSITALLFDYSFKLPITIKKLFRKNQQRDNGMNYQNEIIRLNYTDKEILEEFNDRIDIEVNSSTGMIILSSTMPDPVAAAELTNISFRTLEKMIIDFKINKAKENLEFIKERHLEAEKRYNHAQEKLAIFNDRNKNVITSTAQIDQQRLQNEFDLAYDVYKGLAVKLEQTEIEVKEVTPQFTIVEPVKIPLEKNKPKRMIIMFSSMLIGLLTSTASIIVKYYIRQSKI